MNQTLLVRLFGTCHLTLDAFSFFYLLADDLSIHVSAFDDIVDGPFKSFLTLSSKIGGDVASQGRMVSEALRAQREFLVIVSKSKLPAQTDLQKLLKPTSDKINEIQTFRESNRRSEFFNHLSAISESIPALGWVTVVRTKLERIPFTFMARGLPLSLLMGAFLSRKAPLGSTVS